jgi:hypothetical protein
MIHDTIPFEVGVDFADANLSAASYGGRLTAPVYSN